MEATVSPKKSLLRRIISKKLLLWLLPAALISYIVLMTADHFWFVSHTPKSFQVNWSGIWKTHQYAGFSGNLIVQLPDPLPENEDFTAEAYVYYPIYSTWKTGQFVKMEFQGHFSPDSPTSAGISTNKINNGGSGGKMKFKGVAGNQIVEYVALISKHRTLIVGGYISSLPHDYGYFEISKE
ncbi:hypothetical protein KIH39_25870 [Telmatocola sphagniphila]|uniref:Uncharacterized protein n=1 Tax=Telmatocola sphagniphila TaxID=1123043 RepID=A0A8E6B6D5_9BACT|nr:hypothetical protein [Telmatocola sphagniphila]QVL32222.1 hypothetical protein KIH39_25870 [Telmatocola sphagniphila]